MAINPHEPTPIELMTTDELVEELKRRSSSLLVTVIMPAPNGSDGDDITTYYKGGFAVLVGMARLSQKRLELTFLSQGTDGDSE